MHQGLSFTNIYVHDCYGIFQAGLTSPANSDDIWNSAGIEITGPVSVGTGQYALSGLTMANIEGTRNQDSVSIDWDNSANPNITQNALLSNLYLHDDNGSLPGCAEGLRITRPRTSRCRTRC